MMIYLAQIAAVTPQQEFDSVGFGIGKKGSEEYERRAGNSS